MAVPWSLYRPRLRTTVFPNKCKTVSPRNYYSGRIFDIRRLWAAFEHSSLLKGTTATIYLPFCRPTHGGQQNSLDEFPCGRLRALHPTSSQAQWNEGAKVRVGREEVPKVCGLFAGGSRIRTIGMRKISSRFERDFCRLRDGSGSREGFVS